MLVGIFVYSIIEVKQSNKQWFSYWNLLYHPGKGIKILSSTLYFVGLRPNKKIVQTLFPFFLIQFILSIILHWYTRWLPSPLPMILVHCHQFCLEGKALTYSSQLPYWDNYVGVSDNFHLARTTVMKWMVNVCSQTVTYPSNETKTRYTKWTK